MWRVGKCSVSGAIKEAVMCCEHTDHITACFDRLPVHERLPGLPGVPITWETNGFTGLLRLGTMLLHPFWRAACSQLACSLHNEWERNLFVHKKCTSQHRDSFEVSNIKNHVPFLRGMFLWSLSLLLKKIDKEDHCSLGEVNTLLPLVREKQICLRVRKFWLFFGVGQGVP